VPPSADLLLEATLDLGAAFRARQESEAAPNLDHKFLAVEPDRFVNTSGSSA
jgi:hypothetical protein